VPTVLYFVSAYNVEDGRGGRTYADGVESSSQTCLLDGTVASLFEKDRGIGCDGCDAGPGSHYLEPQAEPRSTSEVSSIGGAAKEDFDELNGRAGFGPFCYCTDLVGEVSK